MSTSNTLNQGIAHIAFAFGQRPFCRTARAIICTIPAKANQRPRICAKCQKNWDIIRDKAVKKEVA